MIISLKTTNKDIINIVYNKIYLKDRDYSINIFLCGRNSNEETSIRELIYSKIKDDSRYNVVFPEWLFSDLLGDSKFNLLTLENDLANSVDAVILPLEGLGAFAELGAFTMNKNLLEKILLINDFNKRNVKSFVNLGPVALIKNNNPKNIIYYRNLVDDSSRFAFLEEIIKAIRRIKKVTYTNELKNIFNLSRFLLYLIALFQPISNKELLNLLKYSEYKIPDYLMNPSISILFEKNKITKNIIEKRTYIVDEYYLTSDGHAYIYEILLKKLNLINTFSSIRTLILNKNLRKNNKKIIKEEIARFLDVG